MKDSHSGRALLPSKLPGIWGDAFSSMRVSNLWGNTGLACEQRGEEGQRGPLFQNKQHADATLTMPFFTLAISCPHLNIDACAQRASAAATESAQSNSQQKGSVLRL